MSWMDFIDGQVKQAQAIPAPRSGPMSSGPTQQPPQQFQRSTNPPTPTMPRNNLERTFFLEWLKKNKNALWQTVQQQPGMLVTGDPMIGNAFKEFHAESKNLSTNPATGIQAPGVATNTEFDTEKFMSMLKQKNPSVWSRVVDDPVSLRKKFQEFKAGRPIEQLAADEGEVKVAGTNWFKVAYDVSEDGDGFLSDVDALPVTDGGESFNLKKKHKKDSDGKVPGHSQETTDLHG